MQAEAEPDLSSGFLIAALTGASSQEIQNALRGVARRWSTRGTRIIGLVEVDARIAGPNRWAARLQNLQSGKTYPLFQNLGPNSVSCHLDGAGIVAACADLCQQMTQGCDLVVLSKFGQLEALRSGLLDAFVLAVELDIPILTAVAPAYHAAWHAFSAPLSVSMPPDEERLDQWWREAQAKNRA